MREVVTKDKKGRITAHPVYTIEEADRLGLPYVHWRECRQPGMWVKTDDGHVLKAIVVGKTLSGMRWVRTAIGTYPVISTTKMTTEYRPNRFSFSGRDKKEIAITPKVVRWAKLFASGMHPVSAYRKVFRSKNLKYIEVRVNRMLNDEGVMKLVREELKAAFKKLGIDEEYVVSRYKRICEHADNHSVRLRALDSIAKMMGLMSSDRQPQGNNIYLGFSEGDLKRLGAAQPQDAPGPEDEDRARRIDPALVEASTQQEGVGDGEG